MKLWPVNQRSILKDSKLEAIAKKAQVFALKNIENKEPIYCIENNVLYFCCNGAHKNFAHSYGFFIDEYPHTDEYQEIYKGMSLKEFENILKYMGFKKIKGDENG
jgi:hypothetical protein